MIWVNITNFVLISWLEKAHSMTETRGLKNVVIFIQSILVFVLWRKITLKLFSNEIYFRSILDKKNIESY